LLAAAVGVGAFVSFCRVASGAHFFSDTIVSFFVMLLVADIFYYYLLSAERERLEKSEAVIVADVQPATPLEP
jgi:membrane-associated phospholipid phosphatase